MNDIRVVIVDDEKPARDRIRRMLSDHEDLRLVGEADNVRSATDLIDAERPDLCLLDVRMPGGDGFDVLRRVRHLPRVVFTTAFDQYAVRAFEVHSLDYLLKPYSAKRFAQAMDRVRESVRREPGPEASLRRLLEEVRTGLPAIKALAEGRPGAGASPGSEPGSAVTERIPARRGTRVVLLDPTEVLYFEAEDTLVFAATTRGRLLVERTLAELEPLVGDRFFRSHRSFLVNLGWVEEIQPEEAGTFRLVLKDEARTAVALSRRQARRLRARFPW